MQRFPRSVLGLVVPRFPEAQGARWVALEVEETADLKGNPVVSPKVAVADLLLDIVAAGLRQVTVEVQQVAVGLRLVMVEAVLVAVGLRLVMVEAEQVAVGHRLVMVEAVHQVGSVLAVHQAGLGLAEHPVDSVERPAGLRGAQCERRFLANCHRRSTS
jgi:hypothetical protein